MHLVGLQLCEPDVAYPVPDVLEQVPIDAHRGALERAHVLERLDVGLHVLVDGHGLAGLPLQPLVLLLELEADLEQLPLGLGLPLGLERAHRLAPLAVGVLVLEHPTEGRLLSPQEGSLVVHSGPFLLAPNVHQSCDFSLSLNGEG